MAYSSKAERPSYTRLTKGQYLLRRPDTNFWYNINMGENKSSNKKCELCKSTLTSKYGSGRFCSPMCARSFSTRANRKAINDKVSEAMQGRKLGFALSSHDKYRLLGAKRNHELKLARKVKINGDVLDITYLELDNYRKKHSACEICKRPEVFLGYINKTPELSVDHCHETMKFRGLLCKACNFRLGWFENQRDNILEYMSR